MPARQPERAADRTLAGDERVGPAQRLGQLLGGRSRVVDRVRVFGRRVGASAPPPHSADTGSSWLSRARATATSAVHHSKAR